MEIVLFAPLMLLAVLLALQAAVWALADLSARHAAQQGMQAARLHATTEADGHTAASALLAEINPRGLTNVQVTVDRQADTTTVTVTGTALRIIPVIDIRIRARAAGPTEPTG